ncbi:MAG: heme-dependent oxidative N-demethylase subunit alpha family protein, partial [Schleiferiaceae bacterium]
LEALALECREDVALLRNGVLEAIAFAFPSGFRPTSKLGLDFAEVHAPVAEGEALRAASAGITAAMKRAHFERGVWTLTSLPTLSQHPDYERPPVRREADLFFRTEFQVLRALGNGWTGFSVRVEMTPWQALSEAQQTRIKASLASMSAASRSYKNLHEIAALLGV